MKTNLTLMKYIPLLLLWLLPAAELAAQPVPVIGSTNPVHSTNRVIGPRHLPAPAPPSGFPRTLTNAFPAALSAPPAIAAPPAGQTSHPTGAVPAVVSSTNVPAAPATRPPASATAARPAGPTPPPPGTPPSMAAPAGPGAAPGAGGPPAFPAFPVPGAGPATAAEPKPPTEPGLLINFNNTPVEQVLDYYADLVGKTILRSPLVNPTGTFITIKSQSPLSRAEAKEALDTVLALN
ncbi:MAG: hypothetical protein M1608_11040, partial [Candidatus Omnitrophica bacterium]|nr:hypothetical protein [Candidatus Omnitrophota bacterium]